MLDSAVVKLIPADHTYAPDYLQATSGVELLRTLLPEAAPQSITFKIYPTPCLIGSEANIDSIHCPACKEYVSQMWWVDAVGDAYRDAFWELDVDMPCCGEVASLNRLLYDKQVGFARFSLEISGAQPVSGEVLEKVSALYGQPFVLVLDRM